MSQGSSGFYPPLEKRVSWFRADPWILGNSGESWKVFILEVAAAKGVAGELYLSFLTEIQDVVWNP